MRKIFNLIHSYISPVSYAKSIGVKFGENFRITGQPIFGSEPYLISIGNNVTLTKGVTFLNHDGGMGLLRQKYAGIEIIKPIKIGNNVFVGSNAMIMPGVTIGSNVIIGASTVVTKNIPDNVVVAGVPGRVIKTFQEYEEKALKEAIYIKSRSNAKARMVEIKRALGII
ncbi:acyltransferase [Dyadobacter pollutisoli]|jgi:acetyltransferase-like isoleucine patch superfamily enzyme|uniref:acyltransferase n=1 Tax=Dyadobacter pollutisoli TaxID=2910158 RepID=UPI00244AA0F5|nr:acyltransferase [Dyadobacter pollutisoli]